MVRATLPALILLALAGCAALGGAPEPKLEIQRVNVPVQVARTPPVELVDCRAHLPPAPVFVKPADPALSSGLTPDGEHALEAFVGALDDCEGAWRAWAIEK